MKIGDTIYLDHQASTPVDPRVLTEMVPFFEQQFGNPHSSEHVIGWQAAAAVDDAAGAVARLIGADADEIIFTSGATEANNLALLGLARAQPGGKRRRILLGATEHKSVLALGRVLRDDHHFQVDLLPVEADGRIEVATLEAGLDDDVLLVSIMAVNNEIGTIADIEVLAAAAHAAGAFFHTDAAQAPCGIDPASLALHADLISLSSHKMYGPAGVGALFVRRELQGLMQPVMHGGGQQRGLRSGTLPLPLCVGMGAAARSLRSPEAAIEREALRRRRDLFVDRLADFGWPTEQNGAHGAARHPGNANLLLRGFSAQDVIAAFQPRLAASTGSACTSGIPEPSHVLRAIGRSADEADASIRFSFGRYTTDDDAEEAARIVAETLASLTRTELRAFA